MSEQLTGRALDRAIAEALGWRINIVNDPQAPYAEVFAPDGTEVTPNNDPQWAYAPFNYHEAYPAYHADANATLAVCAERGWYLSFTGNTALIAYPIGGDFARTHRGDGTTPQEAGARALLAALTATADR